ncbi:MAG: RidA family protein [Candidatus Hadarchaeum sp.]|uniref:RidA family protein n=1 Tax=Candidatus Hadarchaeum sp. TaxID=2883567 RepID=UPI00316EA19B
MRKIFQIKDMPPAVGYSRAIRAGNFLFVCAQVPENAKGETVSEGDFETQARQVFYNLEKVVTEAGGNLSNIVELTAFLTDMKNLDIFRKVRGEYFKDYWPVCTIVEVSRLLSEKWMIAVKAVAYFDE